MVPLNDYYDTIKVEFVNNDRVSNIEDWVANKRVLVRALIALFGCIGFEDDFGLLCGWSAFYPGDDSVFPHKYCGVMTSD